MAVPLIILLILLASLLAIRRGRRTVPLPPGPPADPLIGHLRIFPRINPHEGLTALARKYGEIMHFNILGRSIIVLNSLQCAVDLLDRRSSIYSSRPSHTAYELVGWDDVLAFLPYGEKFLLQRKLFQQTFSRSGSELFRPTQFLQTQILIRNILLNPEQFSDHVRRWSAAVVVEIAYGHEVKSADDDYVQLAEKSNDILADLGDTSLIDLFPALKHLPAWFPGAWFVRYGQKYRPVVQRMKDQPFEYVQQEIAAGTARTSFLTIQLEEMRRLGDVNDDRMEALKVAAMHMYAAGVETTWSTLMNFIATMLIHPHAQKTAQQEIDRVIGVSRLPDFSDRDSLPYVECVVQESARWHLTAPLGIPHRTLQDDIYKGMYIPKGSSVIANAAAMTLDESVYTESHEFRPERYLPEGGAEPYPTNIVYGFGRRICPGRHLADAGAWLVAANILAAFDICPAEIEGKPESVNIEFITGLTSHPRPFKCQFRPRSKNVQGIVE